MRTNLPSCDTLLVAIRAKCMDCCGHCRKLVEQCRVESCPLHPFRTVRAVAGEHERQPEIKGQLDLFEVLMATKEEAI